MPVRPAVIAHRGACGYLPEHTLVAKALAVGMGADFLEQDVVATRDGVLIVFHDLALDATTDVAERFSGRARSDGQHWCMDFDLAELRTLRVRERRRPGSPEPRYPGRFPDAGGGFGIVTLQEELAFVAGLRRSTGRALGIYPEIKDPAWHRAAGIELGDRLLDALAAAGYSGPADACYVQCFDPEELRRLRARGCRLRLVQLLDRAGGVPDSARLHGIARYADAIGPSLALLLRAGEGGGLVPTELARDARAAGLEVHPYTLRQDELPPGVASFDRLLDLVYGECGATAAFTDFPDLASRFVARRFPA